MLEYEETQYKTKITLCIYYRLLFILKCFKVIQQINKMHNQYCPKLWEIKTSYCLLSTIVANTRNHMLALFYVFFSLCLILHCTDEGQRRDETSTTEVLVNWDLHKMGGVALGQCLYQKFYNITKVLTTGGKANFGPGFWQETIICLH